ncbi:MAG: FkbM family methyltransferase, partial [Spirulinaceae cyanobacterium]
MDKSKSELDFLIPPEIKNDQFYGAIEKIAREADIKTVLEIGSSSGEGSTEAFVKGLRDNPNQPQLFCLEISRTRFEALQKRYASYDFVHCYNLSSISLEKYPDEQEIIDFYQQIPSNLNYYELDRVLGWLSQGVEYIKNHRIEEQGIQKIKQEHNIENFDLVLIDGSEFTGKAELDEVYGAKYIFLDDINTFKNYDNLKRLVNDSNYQLIANNLELRNGYAIFQKNTSSSLFSYETFQS